MIQVNKKGKRNIKKNSTLARRYEKKIIQFTGNSCSRVSAVRVAWEVVKDEKYE